MGGLRKFFLLFLSGLLAVEPCLASQRFCIDKFTEISGGNGRFHMLLNSMQTVKAKYANPQDHRAKEDAELFKNAIDAVANSLEKTNTVLLAGMKIHIERGKRLRIRIEELEGWRNMESERRFEILLEGILYGLLARIRENPASFQHIDIEGKFVELESYQRILSQYGFQRASLSSLVRRHLTPLAIFGSAIALPFFWMWGGNPHPLAYISTGFLGFLAALITRGTWGAHEIDRLSLDVIPTAPSTPGGTR